jgi:CheY-like chemotaxis protein
MTKKILIVADDAGQRRAVRGILEPLGTILEASNGKDALRLVANEKPDLILLDVARTELDGFTIMRAARFLDPHLLIAMSSDEHNIETAQRTLGNVGIGAYIKKPCDPEGLRNEVRRLFVGTM